MHPVDEAGEQLGLVGAVGTVARVERLKRDGEVDAARADDVLDLEVLELDVGRPHLLDHLGVHLGSLLGLLLTLCAGDDHFTGPEYQRSRLWLPYANDHSRKTPRIEFCIPASQCDLAQIQGCTQTRR